MALETVFEKEVCGRCGGCGRYSYCQRYGSTCFGCGGKGERLTKRGAAAAAFYVESCMVAAEAIEVGHMIKVGSVTMAGDPFSYKAPVVSIEPHVQRYKMSADPEAPWLEAHQLMLHTESKRFGKLAYVVSPGGKVRHYFPAEENAAKIAAALEYQAGLSKAGKPMKRRAA